MVGAGPTGLLTALALARAGVQVEIIDRAWRSAGQSYACGLHASTLGLLSRLGFGQALIDAGLSVDTMAFYEGSERRAEILMNKVDSDFPFLLVLPQDQLEERFEEELRGRGVRVQWGHRLDDLRQDENGVTAVVEKLGVTSIGYPVARSEESVEETIEVQARFLVGADGASSIVRRLLGIQSDHFGPPAAFEMFEFSPDRELPQEVRVALGPTFTDVLWPQPGALCRWSLQLPAPTESPAESLPETLVVLDEDSDREARRRVESRIRAHAPWFEAGIQQIDWTANVTFQPMLARSFGRQHCWLVGDAGHQTSPVGMQSMNIGLREADDLANRLERILKHSASLDLLTEYDQTRRAEWLELLRGAKAAHGSWTNAYRERLLACLPGSGPELRTLAAEIGLSAP